MTYTVIWSHAAKNQDAELWLAATDRNAISRATNQIDRLLRQSPKASAIYLREGLWKVIVPPLAAIFEVRDDDCIVEVAGIRRIEVE
jgi:hypothetical protein